MDTGEGVFSKLADLKKKTVKVARKHHPSSRSIFSRGETVQIKESFFRVEQISKHKLVLKLIKGKA